MRLSSRALLFTGVSLSACQAGSDPPESREAALVGPAFVQGAAATPQTQQTSVAVRLQSPQSAGNLLVVFAGWNDTVAAVSSVTDSRGDTFARAIGPTKQATALSQSIYYAKSIAGGANTVTVSFSRAAMSVDIRVLEYAGVDTAAPLDSAAAASGSSGLADTGALTTHAAGELLVAGDMVLTGTPWSGPGYAARLITTPDGDIAQDRAAGAAGTYNATAPVVGPNGWVIQVAAFKPASGSVSGAGGSGAGGASSGGSGMGGSGIGGSGMGGSGTGGSGAGGSGMGGSGTGGSGTGGTTGAGGTTSSGVGGGSGGAPTTAGPLRVSTVNRRYFADRNGKIVYLTGSHTWGNFHDRGLTDPPAPFDFNLFLDFLGSHNHNFIRLWAWEQPHSWNNNLDQLKRYFTSSPGSAPGRAPPTTASRNSISPSPINRSSIDCGRGSWRRPRAASTSR